MMSINRKDKVKYSTDIWDSF